ncbi:Actin-related protein 4A [Glycine soja]
MYDEVSTIVIDLGSHTCKASYVGEDAPKVVFPSRCVEHTLSHTYVVGTIDKTNIDGTADINNENSDKTKGECKLYVGSQSLGCHRDHMEVLSPLKDGVVIDWNIVDNIWDRALRHALDNDSSTFGSNIIIKKEEKELHGASESSGSSKLLLELHEKRSDNPKKIKVEKALLHIFNLSALIFYSRMS